MAPIFPRHFSKLASMSEGFSRERSPPSCRNDNRSSPPTIPDAEASPPDSRKNPESRSSRRLHPPRHFVVPKRWSPARIRRLQQSVGSVVRDRTRTFWDARQQHFLSSSRPPYLSASHTLIFLGALCGHAFPRRINSVAIRPKRTRSGAK